MALELIAFNQVSVLLGLLPGQRHLTRKALTFDYSYNYYTTLRKTLAFDEEHYIIA